MEENLPLSIEMDKSTGDTGSSDKDIIGKIVVLLVIILVLVASYIAITYYLEIKYSALEIVVKDEFGKEIENSYVLVTNEYGFKEERMGSAFYEFELESGRYKIVVRSPGYLEKEYELELSEDRSLIVVLEKPVVLRIKELYIPEQVICPSTAYGSITIKNESSEDKEASLVFDGFTKAKLSLIPDTLLIPAKDEASGTIEISCSSISSKQEVSGYIGIKGEKDKNYVTFKLLPVPKIEFEKYIETTIDVNQSDTLTLIFQNRADYEVSGLLLEIKEVLETESNTTLQGMLSFDEEIDVYKKEFSLKANGVARIPLYIRALSKEANIKAKVYFSAPFYKEAEEIEINIKVLK